MKLFQWANEKSIYIQTFSTHILKRWKCKKEIWKKKYPKLRFKWRAVSVLDRARWVILNQDEKVNNLNLSQAKIGLDFNLTTHHIIQLNTNRSNSSTRDTNTNIFLWKLNIDFECGRGKKHIYFRVCANLWTNSLC